jgi:hypothetical protein
MSTKIMATTTTLLVILLIGHSPLAFGQKQSSPPHMCVSTKILCLLVRHVKRQNKMK